MKLTQYNTKTGKFVLNSNEYTLQQLKVIMLVLNKYDFTELYKYQEMELIINEKKSVLSSEEAFLFKTLKPIAKEQKLIQKILFDTKLDPNQLNFYFQLLSSPLEAKQLKIIMSSKFSLAQMNVISAGFLTGLDIKEMKIIANAKLDIFQMNYLKNKLVEGTPLEVVSAIADPRFNLADMKTNLEMLEKDMDQLTDEAKIVFLKNYAEEAYLNQLIDTNIDVSFTAEDEVIFSLDKQKLKIEDLDQILGKGGDPNLFESKKEFLLKTNLSPDIKNLLDFAITADLGNITYELITKSKTIDEAKKVFSNSFEETTGRSIKFGRSVHANQKNDANVSEKDQGPTR